MTEGKLRQVLVLLCVGVLLASSGCDFIKKQMEQAEEKAEEKKKDDANVELGKKLNGYIPCFNQAAKRIFDSRRRYMQWLDDPQAGPTGSEKVVYGLYPVDDSAVDSCKSGIAAAKDKPPTLEDLEKEAASFEVALGKVLPLIAKAHKYYDGKKYKEDKMAEGKAMHKELMGALDAFVEAENSFGKSFDVTKRQMAERELKRIAKEEGEKLRWHSAGMMMDAKDLYDISTAGEQMDLDKTKPALEKFEKSHQAMSKYATEHKSEAAAVTMYSSYQSATDDFLKSMKAYYAHNKEKKEFSNSDIAQIQRGNAKMVEGHPSHLLDKYNKMIDRSNLLSWPAI